MMDQRYATHLPALLYCVLKTTGPVLEIGSGPGSTPILRHLCGVTERDFASIESDSAWAESTGALHSADYAMLPELANGHYSVVFIDNAPEGRRWQDALLFKDSAQYIVIHDLESAETAEGFGLHGHNWKHHRADRSLFPHTLILSQGEI